MYSVHTKEAVCHSRPSVTAGGNEHIDFLLSFLAYKVLKETCHKSSAYVFEGECRSVKQLQTVYIVVDFYNRTVKLQRIIHYLIKCFLLYILAKECRCNYLGNLVEGQILYGIKEVCRQLIQIFRHV